MFHIWHKRIYLQPSCDFYSVPMLRAVVLLLASSSASALLNLGAARAPTNKKGAAMSSS